MTQLISKPFLATVREAGHSKRITIERKIALLQQLQEGDLVEVTVTKLAKESEKGVSPYAVSGNMFGFSKLFKDLATF